MLTLKIDTNLPQLDRTPEYLDPIQDYQPYPPHIMTTEVPKPRAVAQIQSQQSSRGASPQPTHFSLPSANGHRVLRSATVGYVAPEFTGKVEQMQAGKFCVFKSI